MTRYCVLILGRWGETRSGREFEHVANVQNGWLVIVV